jgi:hypothetical protein
MSWKRWVALSRTAKAARAAERQRELPCVELGPRPSLTPEQTAAAAEAMQRLLRGEMTVSEYAEALWRL